MVSTYPPRACGIATFAADLCEALAPLPGIDAIDVVAVSPGGEQYDNPVAATIDRHVESSYAEGARSIERLGADVVVVQHEYGIFGGDDGAYVLALTRELSIPYVVTLHTVLTSPTESQLAVVSELCRRAAAVLVFTATARDLVISEGIAAEDVVHIVPHGAPQVICDVATRPRWASIRAAADAAPIDVSERFVLSSFGLLSPGKGLDVALDALAKLVPVHPEVLLVIAGRTHPEVTRRDGESYRIQLNRRIDELELGDHVVCIDRFLAIDELADLLAATDVYVTAYPSAEQIVSGTLTFAVAAGRPVVSTPYLYARDLLAGGVGRLVPFLDPGALAAAVEGLIESPATLAELRCAAQHAGAGLSWPKIGEATASILTRVATTPPPTISFPQRISDRIDRNPLWKWGGRGELPEVRTEHLLTLVDDVGIVQHATGTVPNRATGYCVDDVARLVQVAARLGELTGEERWRTIARRGVAFLRHAVGDAAGMHNLMSYDRRWLDEPSVGDHLGRSIWALGDLLGSGSPFASDEGVTSLFEQLCGAIGGRPLSLRTAAYALLGLAHAGEHSARHRATTLRLASELVAAYDANRGDGWEWFEPKLTYDNARTPQALIAAAVRLGDGLARDVGLRTLRWYGDRCSVDVALQLPGNGWVARGEPHPGTGDEQPIDAAALVEAECEAARATGDHHHYERALAGFAWFTGRNRLGADLYDASSGGCRDGLATDHVNANQGAESTLAYFTARLALEPCG